MKNPDIQKTQLVIKNGHCLPNPRPDSQLHMPHGHDDT